MFIKLRPTFLAGALMPLLTMAELPPARSVAVRPINITSGGVPIPNAPALESAHPASIPLWANGAPGFESRRDEPEEVSWRQEADIVFPVVSNIHNPTLTPFLPEACQATGCAVIIAPGGGHMQHTIDREGYDLGRWLASRGIAAFVLKYRLARDGSNPTGQAQPYQVEREGLADAARAIRLVRSRGGEWNLQADRIGILGFSAGGEIALLAATRHDTGKPDLPDGVERQSSRPDFFAPIYPGGLQRTDLDVSKNVTPPAFLCCAYDDRMPEQLAAFFTRLRQAGVNAELHVYSRGGHGFGVRGDRADYAVSSWQVRFTEWLGDQGFLKK